MDATETLDNTPRGHAAPVPARAPRPVPAFAFDAVMGVVLMLAISVAFGIGWTMASTGAPGTMSLLWMTALGMGGAALLMYFWRRRATPAERAASARAARRPSTWGWAALVAGAMFAGTSLLQWLMGQAGIEVEPTNLQLIQDGLAMYPVQVLVFAALLAPAYEELLFRRVLFGRLWAAGRPWLGMLLSSSVFALMHEFPGVSGNPIETTILLWAIYGLMGAAFAWVYWRTGTLWAAFGAHALHNLASCLVLLAIA